MNRRAAILSINIFCLSRMSDRIPTINMVLVYGREAPLYSSSLFVDRSKSLHPYYSPYIANTGRIPYVLVAASLLASPYCETKAYVCELDTFRNQ